MDEPPPRPCRPGSAQLLGAKPTQIGTQVFDMLLGSFAIAEDEAYWVALLMTLELPDILHD
jgi:hypothetical protein